MQCGDSGTEMDPRINTNLIQLKNQFEVNKYCKDAFRNTSLDSLLQKHQINNLVISGIDAEHCVYATATAALNRSYKVFLLKDAIGAKRLSKKKYQ